MFIGLESHVFRSEFKVMTLCLCEPMKCVPSDCFCLRGERGDFGYHDNPGGFPVMVQICDTRRELASC